MKGSRHDERSEEIKCGSDRGAGGDVESVFDIS